MVIIAWESDLGSSPGSTPFQLSEVTSPLFLAERGRLHLPQAVSSSVISGNNDGAHFQGCWKIKGDNIYIQQISLTFSMTFLLYYFNKCFQAFTNQLDSKLQRSHYFMPTYFCLDFLFCTQYETKVTFPNLCNLTSLPKRSYCLSPMRRALPCSRINNTTSIDRKGKGQSR